MNKSTAVFGLAIAALVSACGGDPSTSGESGTTAPAVSDPPPTDPPASDPPASDPPVDADPVDAGGQLRGAWTVEIVRELPHDPQAHTQGLELFEGRLFESTGRQSTLRELDPATGEVLTLVPLERPLFGEGLTVVGDEIIQLTFLNRRALRWDVDTLEPVGEFSYEGEGWGICALGDDLVMSDGTAVLTRRDPATFAALDTVTVRRDGQPVELLNELECLADGTVLANVWKSDEIVVIDPRAGTVEGTIDAALLRERVNPATSSDVLNGIADLGDGTFLLGGKNWDRHFVVRFVAE